MPDQTTILSLPHILPSQAQKHVTHNEALRLLDVMVQLTVLQRALSAPPVSPAFGDRHIVAAAPTAAWAGQAGKIALWNGTAWEFFTPLPGWRAYVVAETAIVVFDGTGWSTPGGAAEFDVLGVNMAADTTNKLAVNSAAALFSNPAGSHRLAISKGAAADTGSVQLQQNFVTHAEVGLVADNHLTMKVSPNGSTFFTALRADKDSGRIALDQPVQLVPVAGDATAVSDGYLWYNATTGKFRARQAGSSIDLISAGGGGGGTVFSDADFRIEDNLDATKKAVFQAAGITTATTRTYSLPNADGEIALLTSAQTFTGDKVFTGSVTFRDNNLFLSDLADPSKLVQFSLDNLISGSTRTWNFPNYSGVFATTTSQVQTFQGSTTFANPILTFGSSVAASTIAIGNGATTTGVTKDVQIGTAGLSGSTTTVSIGSAVPGALGQTTIASPTLSVLSSAVTMANAASVTMAGANVSASLLGLGGATATTTNRLSVNTPAVLLNNAGTSIDMTFNKNAAANDASLSFKTGFSTRAIAGLTGSDDFTLKVSPDGTGFFDALTVARATGRVTIANGAVINPAAGDLATPVDGALWYNSTTGKFRARQGGASVDVIGAGGATNLTYDGATRVIASDTGTDATLPLVTTGQAGLAPASGGGTANFLRADGTWAAPAGGGADPWSYLKLAANNVVSTTALADVTGMAFTALANTDYEVEIFGASQSAATTTGIGIALNIPSGTVDGMTLSPSSTTGIQGIMQRADDAVIAPSTAVGTINVNWPLRGKYLVAIGATGGTVQLRQSSEVAASATTLMAGLRMKWRVI